jgi:hypothetical protein
MNPFRHERIVIPLLSLVLGAGFAAILSAKAETVKMTITGSELPQPVEITDKSILAAFKIWSGPGNFKIENGVRTPILGDGSILWSLGAVPEPPKGLPHYDVSFYGQLSEEATPMYVLKYLYDASEKKGYVYLPGKGEEWYEVNVHSIYRGVEGQWFRASDGFCGTVEPLIRKAKMALK